MSARRPLGPPPPRFWPSDPLAAYRLRWKRRRLLARAIAKRRQLDPVVDRTRAIAPGAILCVACIRNERRRLPHWLEHYRRLGIDHFLIVDNDSDDGGTALLADQNDVSLWSTGHSYRLSRFGLDWLTWLMIRFAHGHWCLTVDADELLIYPYWQSRPLAALAGRLADEGRDSFGTLMLDLYPPGPLGDAAGGGDPLGTLTHFDGGNYTIRVQEPMRNLWVQGGPRARAFFADDARRAPTLQKVPFVRWSRRHVYVNSTHAILPRSLNRIYDDCGGERLSGLLLHTKFLDEIVRKSAIERARGEHFANSALYDDYYAALTGNPTLSCPTSTRLGSWRQLEAMGLMSRGGWV